MCTLIWVQLCLPFKGEAAISPYRGTIGRARMLRRSVASNQACQCVHAGMAAPHAWEAHAGEGLGFQHLMHEVASCSLTGNDLVQPR